MTAALPRLRLSLKRTFLRYYLDLCSLDIADPGPAYDACAAYLAERRRELGPELYRMELREDGRRLAGEVEQDLRLSRRSCSALLEREPLEPRLRECLEAGARRLSA
jgi:hypothetical protein